MAALRSLPARSAEPSACIITRNPFDPDQREVGVILDEMSLSSVAAYYGIDPTARPVIAKVNGAYVLQKDWASTWVDAGSFVEFFCLVQSGAKNVLKTILSIVLVVAAVALALPTGGLSLAVAGALGVGAGVASAIIGATIIAGGSLLLNAVIPPSKPTSLSSAAAVSNVSGGTLGGGSTGGGGSIGVGAVAGPSPTYSIGAQSNTARLGAVIPVIYGRHLVYPDYCAMPWTEFETNKQYLYQLFVIGEGRYEIEQYRIGEAQIGNFTDLDYGTVEPDAEFTEFATNVYSAREVVGQTLFGTNEAEAGPVGPFPANPPGTSIAAVNVDLALPRGLIEADLTSLTVTATITAREIDDEGTALTGYSTIGTFNFTATTTTAQRFTFTYALPYAGRWEVRVQRTNAADIDDPGSADLLVWEGLKGILTSTTEFGGVTLLWVWVKASDQLNGTTSRLINTIVTRKLPIWNGEEWSSPQATRSIAWAAADMLRNQDYGAGLTDDEIDLAGLLELDAIWTERGDTFNAVFDNPSTVWDCLAQILRAGRARAFQQGGKIRFYRDQEQEVPIGMFSLANINQNTFSLQFAFPIPGETASGIEGEFFNELVWRPAVVLSGEPERARESLFGITNEDQAQRETDYQERANRLRRVFVSFETELEGLIPSQGDLIVLSHDLPEWGFSGDVVGWDEAPMLLRLSVDVELDAEFSWTIQLRDTRGRPSKLLSIQATPFTDQVQLLDAPAYYDDTYFNITLGESQEPTHFAIGRSSREPRLALVTGISPKTDTIEIQAVLENDGVHVEA
jgi:sulfur carrier protein ThiS